jgi:hypothetical protein
VDPQVSKLANLIMQTSVSTMYIRPNINSIESNNKENAHLEIAQSNLTMQKQ